MLLRHVLRRARVRGGVVVRRHASSGTSQPKSLATLRRASSDAFERFAQTQRALRDAYRDIPQQSLPRLISGADAAAHDTSMPIYETLHNVAPLLHEGNLERAVAIVASFEHYRRRGIESSPMDDTTHEKLYALVNEAMLSQGNVDLARILAEQLQPLESPSTAWPTLYEVGRASSMEMLEYRRAHLVITHGLLALYDGDRPTASETLINVASSNMCALYVFPSMIEGFVKLRDRIGRVDEDSEHLSKWFCYEVCSLILREVHRMPAHACNGINPADEILVTSLRRCHPRHAVFLVDLFSAAHEMGLKIGRLSFVTAIAIVQRSIYPWAALRLLKLMTDSGIEPDSRVFIALLRGRNAQDHASVQALLASGGRKTSDAVKNEAIRALSQHPSGRALAMQLYDELLRCGGTRPQTVVNMMFLDRRCGEYDSAYGRAEEYVAQTQRLVADDDALALANALDRGILVELIKTHSDTGFFQGVVQMLDAMHRVCAHLNAATVIYVTGAALRATRVHQRRLQRHQQRVSFQLDDPDPSSSSVPLQSNGVPLPPFLQTPPLLAQATVHTPDSPSELADQFVTLVSALHDPASALLDTRPPLHELDPLARALAAVPWTLRPTLSVAPWELDEERTACLRATDQAMEVLSGVPASLWSVADTDLQELISASMESALHVYANEGREEGVARVVRFMEESDVPPNDRHYGAQVRLLELRSRTRPSLATALAHQARALVDTMAAAHLQPDVEMLRALADIHKNARDFVLQKAYEREYVDACAKRQTGQWRR